MSLIEKIITDMGCRWNPAGSTEVGIDGYVELFEPGSGRATGLHLAVQSKAVSRFDGSADEITFRCRREDIAYWLDAEPPLILVVSRPDSDEAYWLSVRSFFGDAEHADTTVAHFDRHKQRLTKRSYDALLEVARPPDRSVVRVPLAAAENLYCNLIPLRGYPPRIYIAAATTSDYKRAWAQVLSDVKAHDAKGHVSRAWFFHNGNFVGFADPSEEPLSRIVDVGSIEEHDSREWAETEDPEQRRLFVRLLNLALRDDLGAIGIRFVEADNIFVFKGRLDDEPRKFELQNLHQRSAITVVSHYLSKSKDGREFPYLRHNAFEGRFRRLGGKWYVEVNPTYLFTTDGTRKDRFHEERLSGIKRIEGNRAVLSQVLLWNHALASEELFSTRRRLLAFGPVAQFRIERSLPDNDWTVAGDPPVEPQALADLPLFATIQPR